ncbi:hypothetical protein ACJX0J_023790, partial [Zea mays]
MNPALWSTKLHHHTLSNASAMELRIEQNKFEHYLCTRAFAPHFGPILILSDTRPLDRLIFLHALFMLFAGFYAQLCSLKASHKQGA